MATIIKATKKLKPANHDQQPDAVVIEHGRAVTIGTDLIDFSLLNYRKHFRQEDLETFAEQLKVQGIISPLTVRKIPKGRYELVAGERRLRAAKIAKLSTIPVVIRELTDEQVTEIQLAENLQRENPHPMDEAHAVKLMQDTGKNIEEIAVRLGKSKQFVYIRLKLLNLIDAFREMFYSDVLTIQQAVEIATVSAYGQQEFFDGHCNKWKKQKNFRIANLEYHLRQYKYDLRNAPFDMKDKKLVPEMGACSTCSFNSATLKSLFPEHAKQAICTNTVCYQNKCKASLRIGLSMALSIHEPVALVMDGELSPMLEELVAQLGEAAALLRHDQSEITILTEPEEPKAEDYTYDYGDEEPEFEKDEYEQAMKDYESAMTEYLVMKESGEFQKALLEQRGDFIPVLFNPEPPPRQSNRYSGKGLTMKTVQEALKAGTATPEMLDEAIEGIQQREERAKQIDRDKIQLAIHKELSERIRDIEFNKILTEVDIAASRLILFQSMDYDTKRTVESLLFASEEETDNESNAVLFQKLLTLTDIEYSYLIRMAIASKSDSKYPRNETGFILYKVAEAAGINVTQVEAEQEEKAAARNERMEGRIKELNRKKEKLLK